MKSIFKNRIKFTHCDIFSGQAEESVKRAARLTTWKRPAGANARDWSSEKLQQFSSTKPGLKAAAKP